MGATVFESEMFRDAFGTPEMRAVFDDAATIAAYIEAEIALAKAQGETGVIPAAAAQAIAAGARDVAIDRARLKAETENVGYPILGLVRQLSAGLGEAGRYVHWGATTQDIMDTAVALQTRAALALVARDLADVSAALAKLARAHRDTAMAGRTHLQQALPVTFGYKAAVWLSSIERHRERLDQLRPRALLAQLGGAAGTLASLGDKGLAVRAAYARALDLREADVTWHVARDGLAEVVNFLALVTGTLGKIGLDVMMMMATEIGEAFEPFESHRGASSTMPQKRNPISSELMLAAAKGVRQQAGLMLDAMVQDFERATGPWHVEWIALPESFILTAGALAQAKFMLTGLVVDAARMATNLGLTRGLIVAEAAMMGLAPHLGRTPAHDVVYEACRAAIAQDRALVDALADDPRTAALSRAELERLCDPKNYLGASGAMVDRALAARRP